MRLAWWKSHTLCNISLSWRAWVAGSSSLHLTTGKHSLYISAWRSWRTELSYRLTLESHSCSCGARKCWSSAPALSRSEGLGARSSTHGASSPSSLAGQEDRHNRVSVKKTFDSKFVYNKMSTHNGEVQRQRVIKQKKIRMAWTLIANKLTS